MWLFKVINMKRIPLTQNKFALVDDEDYDWLMTWKWCANNMGGHTYYAQTSLPRSEGHGVLLMHRLLLVYPSNGLMVDHINHNGLDNQKSNLRIVTRRQNAENRRNHGSSKYPGVSWNETRKLWQSSLQYDRRSKTLGCFPTEIEAAIARQNFVVNL